MKNNEYKAKSIQSQLLKRLFFVFIILFIILEVYQYTSMKQFLYNSKVEFLDSRFKNVDKEIIIDTDNNELLEHNKAIILNSIGSEDICVAIINRNGDIIGVKNKYGGIITETSKYIEGFIEVPVLSKNEYTNLFKKVGMSSGYHIIKDKSGKDQITIYREIGDLKSPIALVQISTPIENIKLILKEQIRVYIVSSLGVLFMGLILSLAVLKYTLKPLKHMTQTLSNIDEKKLDTRLAENTGQIEIDKLSNKINNLFRRLETSFMKEKRTNDQMRNFILDVSHELRTPLTSIQGFVEVLKMGSAKNKENLDLALDTILKESKRLSKLVNELLLLAKLEQNPITDIKIEDINKIIKEIVPQLEILARGRTLKVDIDDYLLCNINSDQIKQVIFNIVQNSINHTDENKGIIKIKTSKVYKFDKEYVEINIKDNGKGIPKESLDYVFDRLYRVDKHRARNNGGCGLGLSIVKQIIDNHNGKIELKSEEEKGTSFRIYLKAAN